MVFSSAKTAARARGTDAGIGRHGGSRLSFRGPVDAGDGAILMLGGAETWGRCLDRPFSALLQDAGVGAVINLGLANAGFDAYLDDADLREHIARARLIVVQALGAQNLSNAYYSVHPRRNDRFLAPTPALRALYEDVDFTEVTFVRHLLAMLIPGSPQRFALITHELRATWSRRMREMAALAEGRVILLWIARGHPPQEAPLRRLGPDPLFVTRAMVEDLRPLLRGVVEVIHHDTGPEGKLIAPGEEALAARLPGPATHARVAEALIPWLRADRDQG